MKIPPKLRVALSLVLGVALWGWSPGSRGDNAANVQASNPATPMTSKKPFWDKPLVDVDAMAARMKSDQDLYKKIRDAALAEYSKNHPDAKPYDDRLKTMIRLFAYLVVWDDYYGEGLWQLEDSYLAGAKLARAEDPAMYAIYYLVTIAGHSPPSDEEWAAKMMGFVDPFLASNYPAEMKVRVCQAMLNGLVCYRCNQHPDPGLPSMKARERYVAEWGKNYRALLKEHLPNRRLFFFGYYALDGTESNDYTLDRVEAEIDHAFTEVDPNNPVKAELEGAYHVSHAWYSRGSGWSNTVTNEGWRTFAEDLEKADKVLEPVFDAHPDEIGTCYVMMKVELGQGKGRDRLEQWFSRGVKIDPNYFELYTSKEWYLQPRWYGSEEDIISFGKECIAGGNWDAKVPLILAVGLDRIDNTTAFAEADTWTAVEKTYREYLKRFPNSIHYRTLFAQQASAGGHQDIAREQLKILGDEWDHTNLSVSEYQKLLATAGL